MSLLFLKKLQLEVVSGAGNISHKKRFVLVSLKTPRLKDEQIRSRKTWSLRGGRRGLHIFKGSFTYMTLSPTLQKEMKDSRSDRSAYGEKKRRRIMGLRKQD